MKTIHFIFLFIILKLINATAASMTKKSIDPIKKIRESIMEIIGKSGMNPVTVLLSMEKSPKMTSSSTTTIQGKQTSKPQGATIQGKQTPEKAKEALPKQQPKEETPKAATAPQQVSEGAKDKVIVQKEGSKPEPIKTTDISNLEEWKKRAGEALKKEATLKDEDIIALIRGLESLKPLCQVPKKTK